MHGTMLSQVSMFTWFIANQKNEHKSLKSIPFTEATRLIATSAWASRRFPRQTSCHLWCCNYDCSSATQLASQPASTILALANLMHFPVRMRAMWVVEECVSDCAMLSTPTGMNEWNWLVVVGRLHGRVCVCVFVYFRNLCMFDMTGHRALYNCAYPHTYAHLCKYNWSTQQRASPARMMIVYTRGVYCSFIPKARAPSNTHTHSHQTSSHSIRFSIDTHTSSTSSYQIESCTNHTHPYTPAHIKYKMLGMFWCYSVWCWLWILKHTNTQGNTSIIRHTTSNINRNIARPNKTTPHTLHYSHAHPHLCSARCVAGREEYGVQGCAFGVDKYALRAKGASRVYLCIVWCVWRNVSRARCW